MSCISKIIKFVCHQQTDLSLQREVLSKQGWAQLSIHLSFPSRKTTPTTNKKPSVDAENSTATSGWDVGGGFHTLSYHHFRFLRKLSYSFSC